MSRTESNESIKARVYEVSHWTPGITQRIEKADDITLLEASYSEDGKCTWVAFHVNGIGHEIDFEKHVVGRDTSYDRKGLTVEELDRAYPKVSEEDQEIYLQVKDAYAKQNLIEGLKAVIEAGHTVRMDEEEFESLSVDFDELCDEQGCGQSSDLLWEELVTKGYVTPSDR